MQTKKTKEKKSKKTVSPEARQFLIMEYIWRTTGSANSFSPGPEWLLWIRFS